MNYNIISIFLLVLFFSTCEMPDRDNPWDEKASVDASSWSADGFEIQDVNLTSKKLSWTYQGDNRIEGFQIDRKIGAGEWQEEVYFAGKDEREWVDTSVVPDTTKTYTYRLTAVAGVKKSNERTGTVSVRFPGPTALSLQVSTDTTFLLSWTYSSNGHEGFKIDRRKDNEAWQEAVGTVANTQSTFSTKFSSGSDYYYKVYAYYKEYRSAVVTDSLIFPALTTVTASDISSATAVSGGTISRGTAILSRGVCWSTSQNPNVSLSTKTTDGSGTGSFTSSLSGLQPGTTYYVRAYATNSQGTAYGSELSFITISISAPSLSTANVSNVTSSTAISGGNISSNGGASVTARGVCWSTSQNPNVSLSTKTTNGSGTGSFTSSITGLQSGTTYYVRAYATNSQGTAYGSELSFTTISISAPLLSTANVSNVTSSTASSGGYISSDGGASVTARGVCWNTSQNPTVSLSTKTTDGSGTGSFTSSLSGLQPGTTYYVRAYATNSVGTAYGSQVSFTTPTISVPTIATINISNVSGSSASSGGNVSSDGGATVLARGVVWSATQNPTVSLSTKTTDGSGSGTFTSSISGLQPGTTYYVRAYATNSVGTAYGSQVSFTTTSAPAVSTVTSTTGKVWMDRNLGASRVATSSTDSQGYGDLYQWGRGADGHEKRTSQTTTTLSSSNTPGHGDFIIVNSGNYDWRSPQNNNLWQGVNGTNNPCPEGFHIPTSAEWDAERASWSNNNSVGAFDSPLKLPVAGYRYVGNGSLYSVGSNGSYWSGIVGGTGAQYLFFGNGNASMNYNNRADGNSVRCVKDD